MRLTPKDFLLQLQSKQPLSDKIEWPDGHFDILIPFQRFNSELVNELVFFSIPIYFQSERLIITGPLKAKPMYAQDWWPRSQTLPLAQYSELKKQSNWGCYYHSFDSTVKTKNAFPDEKKIRASIKNLDCKRIDWKLPHPFNFKFFTWTVIGEHIFFCTQPFQRFPLGWHEFAEDKSSPPNRAYLKLWEIFLVQNFFDMSNASNQVCIEVGCSPGGWTWVLAQHFKKVYAVDKAPLANQLSKFRNINYQSADAFKLNQKKFLDANWFFSDIICTPDRMNELVSEWLQLSNVTHYISTIKFKGPADFDFLQRFQQEKSRLGESVITHLYHNKNEVTWLFKKNQAKF